MSDLQKRAVCLYAYPAEEGSSERRIQESVEHYCRTFGMRYDAQTYRIARTNKGKPFFAGTQEVFVSLSHSGDHCIVAIAPCQVGVDLQSHDRFPNETEADALQRYLRLSKRFFHPAEHAYVVSQPQERFFVVWTAKESYVKYTGAGLDDDFWTYSVLPDAPFPVDGWSAQQVYFQMIPFLPQYSLCLCTQMPLSYVYGKISGT